MIPEILQMIGDFSGHNIWYQDGVMMIIEKPTPKFYTIQFFADGTHEIIPSCLIQ